MRIVVTGATGFLGRHIVRRLEAQYGASNSIVGLSSADYDLTRWEHAQQMMREHRPDALVHLAAYVGGIGANAAWPADFFYRNSLLVAHVFRAAAEHRVGKVIYTMGGCSYPATATSPIDESQMWNGYPQSESAAYSSAKKMGIVAARAFREQYGLLTHVLVPGNVYGPNDNFRAQESHVIPAMIRRYVEAKEAGAPEVVMWGSGRPERDFVYVEDVAATIPFFVNLDEPIGPINISTGTRTSISILAEAVRRAVGYEGAIRWDVSKPDGQLVKIFDVTAMRKLGLDCPTPLGIGIARTVDWFAEHRIDLTDGIRL